MIINAKNVIQYLNDVMVCYGKIAKIRQSYACLIPDEMWYPEKTLNDIRCGTVAPAVLVICLVCFIVLSARQAKRKNKLAPVLLTILLYNSTFN